MDDSGQDANVPRDSAVASMRGDAAKTIDDMKTGERLAPMTFNMPKHWHTRFKTTAVIHDMSMKDLLIASFDAWERQNTK